MPTPWLSTQAHARLTDELNELKTVGRPAISAEIETARAHGDLRENAEYHAAKEEQGRMEARIRQLEALLRDATVSDPVSTDVVAPGLAVSLEVDGEAQSYLLGSREEQHRTLTVLSPDSPMGQAIVGATVGTTATFATPAGATVSVTVTGITRP
jgi:transcription elongation factor GreA